MHVFKSLITYAIKVPGIKKESTGLQHIVIIQVRQIPEKMRNGQP